MVRGERIGHLWLLQFAADFGAIAAAYYTTLLLRFHSAWGERFFAVINHWMGVRESAALGSIYESFYSASALRIILILTLVLSLLYSLWGLYPGRRFIRKRPVAWHVLISNLMALVLFYTYFYLRRNTFHPRSFFATTIFLNVFYCVFFRALVDQMLLMLRSRFGMDQCRAVMLGFNGDADRLYEFINQTHPHGINIIQRVASDSGEGFAAMLAEVEHEAADLNIDMLILADKSMSMEQIMEVLGLADRLGVSVKVLSDKMDVLMNQARLPMDMFYGIPLVHFEAPTPVEGVRGSKRVISRITAMLLLALLAPLMGIIALLIRLTSRGDAFFIQERIGVNRKPFRMFKFRTMYERSDELQAQVEEFNESGKGLFKIKNDPRVTLAGRALRRFSLDEIPQLINIVRGEMTMVGPRPLPRRDFENYYEEWHYSRHHGMPGLTCLWQISGRSNLNFHNMCILDVYYLRNQTWALDLKIMLKTLWVVLFAKGAY